VAGLGWVAGSVLVELKEGGMVDLDAWLDLGCVLVYFELSHRNSGAQFAIQIVPAGPLPEVVRTIEIVITNSKERELSQFLRWLNISCRAYVETVHNRNQILSVFSDTLEFQKPYA